MMVTASVTCRECNVQFDVILRRGSHRTGRLCNDCKPTQRAAATARYRTRARDAIREQSRLYQARRRAEDPEYVEAGRQRIRDLSGSAQLSDIRKRSYQRHAVKRRAEQAERRKTRRREIYERDERQCYLCGLEIAWGDLEIDHVVPLSKGGPTSPENLRATHRDCNRRKAALVLGAVA